MGEQHDGSLGEDVHQDRAQRFGVGIRQRLVVDRPDLAERGGRLAGHGLDAGAGDEGRGLAVGEELARDGSKLEGRVVECPIVVNYVDENFCVHHRIPPWALSSSTIWSAISSMLPSIISAPSPRSGTK